MPGLLLHGHLDVVPADPEEWEYHPFKGEIVDEVLWGRGAVDMKGEDAIILTAIAELLESGRRPNRTVHLLFTADEEAGGRHGAHWLVENRPELFEGITEAIGEVGGFNHRLPNGKQIFFIQTGEKGIFWARLSAHGTPGHGSMLNDRNAVSILTSALERLLTYKFPRFAGATTTALFDRLRVIGGFDPEVDDAEILIQLGSMGRVIGASLQDTVTPTVLAAGEKVNVVPALARAEIDGRFLPAHETSFAEIISELAGPQLELEVINTDVAYESPSDSKIIDQMTEALKEHAPDAEVVPYLMPGGTDGKAFSKLGITCYGFIPMLLPDDLDAMSMFHAANERVPVSSLRFGVDVLKSFLTL